MCTTSKITGDLGSLLGNQFHILDKTLILNGFHNRIYIKAIFTKVIRDKDNIEARELF